MTQDEIMEMVKKLQAQSKKSGTAETFTTTETLADFGLGDVDCKECNNKGYLIRTDENGVQWSRECPCMKKRRTLRNIKKSGVSNMLMRYNLETYIADDPVRKKLKSTAIRFVEDKSGWLIISGRSGSGKTHLCCAICGELIEKGEEMKYFAWRDDSVSLKAMLNTPEYKERVDKLIRVPVLYIDDFWKGTITDADVNLAFQILNGRYIDSNKRTIISTELPLEAILDKDEAVGGRIFERSVGYRLKAPDENYRLRMM